MKKSIISAILIIIIICIQIVANGGTALMSAFFSLPSLLFLFVLLALVMVMTNSQKHFFNGLKVVFTNSAELSEKELNQILNTYSMMMKATILVVILENIIAIVKVFSVLSDPSQMGPFLALGILSVFYGVIVYLFLTIVKYKAKNELIQE